MYSGLSLSAPSSLPSSPLPDPPALAAFITTHREYCDEVAASVRKIYYTAVWDWSLQYLGLPPAVRPAALPPQPMLLSVPLLLPLPPQQGSQDAAVLELETGEQAALMEIEDRAENEDGAQDESNDKEKNSKDDRALMTATKKVTGKRSWGEIEMDALEGGEEERNKQEAGNNRRQTALYKAVDSSLAGFDYIEQMLNDEGKAGEKIKTGNLRGGVDF